MAHSDPAPAHPHRHGPRRPDDYARRRPEETVLYQTIAEHWPAFCERLAEHGGLPRFVEREFETYLQCGILEFGFLELECRECGHTELVALSCKRRGFCPRCAPRAASAFAGELLRSLRRRAKGLLGLGSRWRREASKTEVEAEARGHAWQAAARWPRP